MRNGALPRLSYGGQFGVFPCERICIRRIMFCWLRYDLRHGVGSFIWGIPTNIAARKL
jgi:hypothetical protein